MSDFRPIDDGDLSRLTPEHLIAYHHEARRLGHHDEARRALGILAWGFIGRVRFWVSRRVPEQEVEDVTHEVIVSAIKSSFDSTEPRQFGAWLKRIAQRRIADFHDAGSRKPKQVPLPDEHEGDDDIWGPGGELPDPTQEVVERSVVEQALGELSEVHRRVVELAGPKDMGFQQRPGRETADLINDQFSGSAGDLMTEANVFQIVSRFRKRVTEIADTGGTGDG